MGQGEGRGGQREEHKSQMVALCSPAAEHPHCLFPCGSGGPLGCQLQLLCQKMWKVSRAMLGSREGSWPFHQECVDTVGDLGCLEWG